MYEVNGKEASKQEWEAHKVAMEELSNMIKKYDWFYEMSDDHRVWSEGARHHTAIKNKATSIGRDGLRLWGAHCDIHYGPHSGFTYKYNN